MWERTKEKKKKKGLEKSTQASLNGETKEHMLERSREALEKRYGMKKKGGV